MKRIVDTKKKSYEAKTITVKEFLSFRPIKSQFYNGKSVIDETTVKSFENFCDSLTSPGAFVEVSEEFNCIVVGHHRQARAKLEVEAGRLSLDFKFLVTVLKGYTQLELEEKAYRNNFGGNTRNKKNSQVGMNCAISNKVIRPILKALEFGDFKRAFSLSKRQKVAFNLANLFNSNPELVDEFFSHKATISGDAIYAQRKGELLRKKDFFDVPANVNLVGKEKDLYVRFRQGLEFLERVSESDTWEQLIRDKKKDSMCLAYIILGAATANKVDWNSKASDMISEKNLNRLFKDEKARRRFRASLTNYYNAPERETVNLVELMSYSA